MNDLLQLRSQPSPLKINHEDENASVSQINQSEHQLQQQTAPESMVKSKEKSNGSHKRPSLACEISSSKRAKGQETVKPQQSMPQKNRVKTQMDQSTSGDTRWPLTTPQKTQQQASNSVLMNLLVSGCDVSAGYYTCLPRPKVAKA